MIIYFAFIPCFFLQIIDNTLFAKLNIRGGKSEYNGHNFTNASTYLVYIFNQDLDGVESVDIARFVESYYPYCTLQVFKCSDQRCALGAMSNFAKMRPDMTSRSGSSLTNQRS